MKRATNKAATSCAMLIIIFLAISLNSQCQNVKEVEDRLMKQAGENIEKYRKRDVTIQFNTKDGNGIKDAKVEIIQKTHDFLFGCIIFDLIRDKNPFYYDLIHDDVPYREDLFKQRFSNLFNLAVFPFYWTGYERQQGMPGWPYMLPVIDWCKAKGITTKGHPLVWSCISGVPQWLKGYTVAETEDLLKARVINTVTGFREKIDIWDVVNEPINLKTWKHKINTFNDVNDDWSVVDSIPLIADYVENALIWAHKANPKSILMINEYWTLANKVVRKRYNDLLEELKKRNAPLNGIGIQAHYPMQEWFQPEEVWKTFDLYAKYGYSIHITELHPQSSGKDITGGWRKGTWTLEAQKEFTEQFVKLCFGHPAVASINWWGFSDRTIWLEGGGLIDKEYRPKPVYTMLDSLINKEWKTKFSTKTDKNGEVAFRGFYGEYEVILSTDNGKVQFYPMNVRKDEENKWKFVVSE